MNRKNIIILIILTLVLFVIIPIAIDWLIIGNSVPSNISNSEWVGFLGAYTGAFLGAIVSLVGIIITIRFTSKENHRNRLLQVRPYCTIHSNNLSYFVQDATQLLRDNKILEQLEIGFEPAENGGPVRVWIVSIKNIGLGPAVEFNYNYYLTDTGRKIYTMSENSVSFSKNYYSKTLQAGEEGFFPVYLRFCFDPIEEKDLEDRGTDGFWPKYELINKYKDFEIHIMFNYRDIFHNPYSQEIVLSVQNKIVRSKLENREWEHTASIILKRADPPRLIGSSF